MSLGPWAALLALLALECVVIGALFEAGTRNGQAQWWAVFLQTHPSRARLALASVAAILLVGGKRFWDEFARQPGSVWQQPRFWPWVPCHLLLFAAYAGMTALIFREAISSSSWPGAWATAWALVGVASVLSWGLAAFPSGLWWWLLRRGWVALPAGLAVGLAAVVAGKLADQLWEPLGQWTLGLVYHGLTLIRSDALYDPADARVGTTAFEITIAPGCSGYQGIGLICVFLGVYLWLFRRYLRFPQALLLLPIGVVVVWLCNALRLIALVALGTWISPELAMGGFHSLAGWLAFLAVGLGLVAVAQQMPFFNREVAPGAEPGRHTNPTAAYLAPVLALVAVSMVTGAFATRIDNLYGLRVLAVAAALWAFRGYYKNLHWTWSWSAVAIGAATFVMWVALEPASSPGSAGDALQQEFSLLPPAWAALWLCLRIVGSVITVPLAEELAFRGYLTRRLIAADFQDVPLGRFTWFSFLISSVAFGALHGRWLAGALAGMAYALALYRRGELSDAVVAHATTNALLALCVLTTDSWALWC